MAPKGGKVVLAARTGKKDRNSNSSRAGLQFPIGLTHRELKKHMPGTVDSSAAIYTAAVLEYLIYEVLEVARNKSKKLDGKLKLITPRHLQLSIRGDEHLDDLIKATIPGGGVVMNISKFLVDKSIKE